MTAETGGAAEAAGDDGAAGEDAKVLAEAARTGKPVEIVSLRGESSEVYATPEGHLEAREHLRPVRTRLDGEWRDIDTTLTRDADGTVVPKATTVGLTFSAGGSAPLVRMTKNGRELALSWPEELPSPELNGNTVTYPDVLPDVDLRMTAQQDGFTQLLVVKSPEAAASPELSELRLKLDADGMRVEETGDGGLAAIDEGAGSAVFEAPRPVMWDSSNKAADDKAASKRSSAAASTTSGPTAGPTDADAVAAESANVARVAVDVPAGQDELVLTPDSGVLKGKDTVYPVFIDPQWYSPKASAWTMASKYWASSPQWKFNGASELGAGAGPVRAGRPGAVMITGGCVTLTSPDWRIQGGARPSELAEHRRPTRRRASSRRPRKVQADGQIRARAGADLVLSEPSCGRWSPRASHSKLSPTTVLRPDRRHRADQRADPSRPPPGSPRAVAGVASGGESLRPRVAGGSPHGVVRGRKTSDGVARRARLSSMTRALHLTAAVTREDEWYVARCLQVEVTSQGESIEEALANLREALELYFEDAPAPEAVADVITAPVEVRVA
ncbi:type II toxin-antitoxin system HicB family antitoxin [Streptomyces sp. T028]|uniref:type II toxin-antitoxin system HicB family antitoxin n=2 Tax=unclassified Streptomyces TaxID=2593676 RepID=UPI003A8BBD15